jgi:hypothetical protein
MATALSIVAIIVAIGTAIYGAVSWSGVSNREVTTGVISDYFTSMHDLTMLQVKEWQLSHLFEIAENYHHAADRLNRLAPTVDELEAERLALRERAVAVAIFGVYEHTVYQLGKAHEDGDRIRISFLTDATRYFAGRLLPNPRLRYLWASEGGNLEGEFESETRRHYREHVGSLEEPWDATGPYG